MTPDERTELEAKADRARRRGELGQALSLYSQIMAAYPHDGIVQTKLNILKESLEPSELKQPAPPPSADDGALAATPLAEAERLASRGEYAEALAIYRRALTAQPENVLLKERMTELFQLVQARSPAPANRPRAPLPKQDVLKGLLERIATRRRAP